MYKGKKETFIHHVFQVTIIHVLPIDMVGGTLSPKGVRTRRTRIFKFALHRCSPVLPWTNVLRYPEATAAGSELVWRLTTARTSIDWRRTFLQSAGLASSARKGEECCTSSPVCESFIILT
jgi:hypothetical protein